MHRRELLKVLVLAPLAAFIPVSTLRPVDDAPSINAMLAAMKPGETLNLSGCIYRVESPIRFAHSHTTLTNGVFKSSKDVWFDIESEGVHHCTLSHCRVYGNLDLV
jgi:hypothetical protein